MEVPPEPWPNVVDGVWKPWAQGWGALLVTTSRPGKGLAGATEAAPGKGLAAGTYFAPLLLCVLGLGIVLFVLGFGFPPASLLCPATCGRGAWL